MAAVGRTPDDRPPLLARAEQIMSAVNESQNAKAVIRDLVAAVGDLQQKVDSYESPDRLALGNAFVNDLKSRAEVAEAQLQALRTLADKWRQMTAGYSTWDDAADELEATLTPPGAAGQET